KPLEKKELEFLYMLAEHLDAPLSLLETYNSSAFNSYINEELERRLETNDAFHKKKSKARKSHKVKDTEIPPLASVPISKKEKH
ncbi:9567_t:CDS:2, partial [Funneliformis geosporum]